METNPNYIVIEKEKSTRQVKKSIGRKTNIEGTSKKAVFVSDVKNLMLFIEDNDFIQFMNFYFETDDDRLIEFIEGCNAYQIHIWRDKFPKDIIKRMEDDQKYITRDITDFQTPEA
jgi:hypothetical protein